MLSMLYMRTTRPTGGWEASAKKKAKVEAEREVVVSQEAERERERLEAIERREITKRFLRIEARKVARARRRQEQLNREIEQLQAEINRLYREQVERQRLEAIRAQEEEIAQVIMLLLLEV